MKRLLLCMIVMTSSLLVMAQKYGGWHSSVTDRDYGVSADNGKGKSFDCLIYGQSLNKHIPIVGLRIASKDIPAFVKEMRALADKAGQWWKAKAPVTGIEDVAILFDTNFKNVTAWFDTGTPPEPEYHNVKDAHVEAYTQMSFVGDGAVYLSVAPIVDKNKNRHPGFILPFGSKQEMEEFITAVERLDPNAEDALQQESVFETQDTHDIEITCPQCGAVFVGKSASLAFNNPRNHEKDCPLFNEVIEVPQVPQVPSSPSENKVTTK